MNPSHESPRRRRPAPKKKGRILAAVLAVLLLAGAGYGAHVWADYAGAFQSGEETAVEIPSGSSGRQIAAILADADIISHPNVFYYYARLTGANFRSGSYTLRSDMGYAELARLLNEGTLRDDVVQVTFPEGYTLREIAAALEENGVCAGEDFLDYLDTADLSSYPMVAQIPEDDRYHALEGYIFPDTYQFYLNEEVESVAARFLDRFEQVVDEEIRDRAAELGMTIDEVVTLASVIQAECSVPSEMPMVSSVFHNRLNNPAEYPRLQSDVTIFYIRDEILPYAGSDSESFYDELYNTYIRTGLPVGPICSPGADAIEAALYPAQSGYYYFISDTEGNFLYAATLDEHNQNIRDAGI